MAREKYPSDKQPQFMIRFPDNGLRDRIKTYAERQGTSMNHEIIRILEREWPEQWPLSSRLEGLSQSLTILAAGKTNPGIQDLMTSIEETIEGIISGRVTGVSAETREAIMKMWEDYQEREFKDSIDDYHSQLDEEEVHTMNLIGHPEKYAVPPQEKPTPINNDLNLVDILPPKSLAELTAKLSEGDIEAAVEVVLTMSREEILERRRSAENLKDDVIPL